jgi:acyl-CoA dehydrogenase
MSVTTLLLFAMLVIWVLAWTGAPLWLWTLAIVSCGYALLQATGASAGWWFAAASALGFMVFVNFTAARTRLLTSAMFQLFKRIVPTLSASQRANLNFGDLWWEGELFRGRPDWNKLLTFQRTRLTDAERELLADAVPAVCEAAAESDDAGWEKAKQLGFMGLGVSRQYSGLGLSFAAQTRVISKVATAAPAFAHDLGRLQRVPEWIAEHGSIAQKQHWLPLVVTGEIIISSAIPAKLGWQSEGCSAKAVVRPAGDNGGLSLRLDFPTHHVRMAARCSMIALPVDVSDPDGLLASGKRQGTAVVLLPRETVGIEFSPSQNTASGANVVVGIDTLIGGEEMIGSSSVLRFEEAVRNRGVSSAGLTSAIGKRGYLVTSAYVRIASGGGRELAETEAAQASMAAVAVTAYRLEAYRSLIGSANDVSTPVLMSSVIKLLSTADVQAHLAAAAGLLPRGMPLLGKHNKQLNALLRADDSLSRLAYGDLFSQLVFRAHPYVLPSIDAIRDNNLVAFDKLLAGYSGYAINRTVRAFSLAISGGWLAGSPLKGPISKRMKQLTRMSAALASVSDISIALLGSQLRTNRRQTARLGEVLCQLTSASAVVKYWYEQGQPKLDEPFVLSSLDQSLWKIQQAFDGYFDNYPSSFSARVIRRIIFPVGASYKQPSDQLERKIAKQFGRPNSLRSRFADGVSMAGQSAQFGLLEEAYLAAADCTGLLSGFDPEGDFDRQLSELISDKSLGDDSLELLRRFDGLRKRVIN